MSEKDICGHLDEIANDIISKIPVNIKDKFYFAGGCIYSLANDKQPKDYDLFLKSDELIPVLKLLNIWGYRSEYALTLGKYQIVTKYYGEPCECVGQFDFKHNMYYYEPFSGHIASVNEEEYENDFDCYNFLHTNELLFNEKRARDIEGVFLRIEKFVDRGMTISKQTKKAIKKRTTRKAIRSYRRSRRYSKSYY